MRQNLMWVALVVSLVIVAGRTLLAADSLLRIDQAARRVPNTAARVDPVARVAQLDSLVTNADPGRRNPFAPPPAPVVVRRTTGTPAAPVRATPPRVALMMVDESTAIIQLEAGGVTSPRLKVGDTFQGWTVLAITPAGVTVVKGNQQENLPRP